MHLRSHRFFGLVQNIDDQIDVGQRGHRLSDVERRRIEAIPSAREQRMQIITQIQIHEELSQRLGGLSPSSSSSASRSDLLLDDAVLVEGVDGELDKDRAGSSALSFLHGAFESGHDVGDAFDSCYEFAERFEERHLVDILQGAAA